ncbi:MAG: endopeptidase La [Bacteroidales bacterium]|nr:endopeptidase La [Bacteroidales bacterium]
MSEQNNQQQDREQKSQPDNSNQKQQAQSNLVLLSDIYPDNIGILPLSNRPIFPGITIPLYFTGYKFVELIDDAIDNNNNFIGLTLVEEVNDQDFFDSKLHEVGTLGKIVKIINKSENGIQFFVQTLVRFKPVRKFHKKGLTKWEVKYIQEGKPEMTDELKAYSQAIMSSVKELINVNPMMQEQMRLSLSQMSYENPGLMMDVIASMLSAEADKMQELLEAIDLYQRSEKLLILLKEEIELSQLQEKIQKQINEKVNKQQKEYFLREQLKVIKQELGIEKDDKSTEIEKIENKAKNLKLTEEASKVIKEEIEKLKVLEPASSEFHVTRSYLHTLTDLPWGIYSDDSQINIKNSRKILDEDHYGLQDVKQRILEFISTIIKRGKVSGSIICLVGPPGVGKTSVGRSIANALHRKFYRFSIGGMRDEAEIKGHRRTYIGAMPGKIIQSLKRTGTSNPVLMLDEIDKLGVSFQGDPASALLEVLDPEQNTQFLDHYLDVRYDLSNVLFITTANQLDTIPQPLLNRMEVIKLPGYILEEKIQIAKKYLIPKQRKEHGLNASEVNVSPGALKKMIDGYAREAGVRSLENNIKKVMRQVTMKQAEEGRTEQIKITRNNLEEFLGKPYFTKEELYKKPMPGVVLGLAWTALGGTTLYVEANSVMSKQGGFKQTGQLGKVMQESSEIALSYVKSLIHDKKKKEYNFFDNHYVHLHVPAGATPKDGPSAGITMALALYSLARNKPVPTNVGMTGELTLTGRILPIGGVREKTIAAKRVGIKNLIFPKENQKDFEELPEYVREGTNPFFLEHFNEVLKVTYDGKLKK